MGKPGNSRQATEEKGGEPVKGKKRGGGCWGQKGSRTEVGRVGNETVVEGFTKMKEA